MLPKFLKPFHVSKSNLIRIGPKTDGGYIVDKRIFNKTDTLITCGLNDDWEFERNFSKKKPNTQIIAFDHSVNQNFWIKRFKKDIISLLLFRKLILFFSNVNRSGPKHLSFNIDGFKSTFF